MGDSPDEKASLPEAVKASQEAMEKLFSDSAIELLVRWEEIRQTFGEKKALEVANELHLVAIRMNKKAQGKKIILPGE